MPHRGTGYGTRNPPPKIGLLIVIKSTLEPIDAPMSETSRAVGSHRLACIDLHSGPSYLGSVADGNEPTQLSLAVSMARAGEVGFRETWWSDTPVEVEETGLIRYASNGEVMMCVGVEQIAQVGDEVGWPVIVKPAVGGGSLDIFRFASKEEFQEFANGPESQPIRELTCPLVVESLVKIEKEFHCDSIVQGGEVRFAKASEYFVPVLDHGEHFGSRLLRDDELRTRQILEMHERAVKATGLQDGVTHMEFFDTGDDFLASEIACRPAGGGIPHAIKLMTGVDVWKACLDTALGSPVDVSDAGSGDPIVHWYLTVPPGRILRMTDPAELRAIRGVEDVVVNFKVGDVIPARQNSAFAAMLVFARAENSAEVQRLTKEIYSTFAVAVSSS